MKRKFLFLGGTLLAAAPLSSVAGSGGGGGGSEGDLVEMEAISVPIVDGARLQGTLHFRLVLEARDAEAAAHLSSDLAGLRSEALLTGMEFSRLRASPFLAVDAHELSEEMTHALRARDDGIARVLLVEVVARAA